MILCLFKKTLIIHKEKAMSVSTECPSYLINTQLNLTMYVQWATSEFRNSSLSKWGQVHNLSCENEFYCMRMKNYFHINGWALHLVLSEVTLNLNISARVSWSLLVEEWIPKAVELERIPAHKKCKCKEFCFQMRLGGEIYSFDVITY